MAGAGFGKAFGLNFGKQDAVKTGRFLLYFILVYLAATLVVEGLFPVQAVELFVASNALSFLQGAGYQGSVEVGETAVIVLEAGPSIEISVLCTGVMETLIIVSAILASVGISWRKRVFGALAAGLATVAFNYVRIVVTAMVILGTGDRGMIEFTHNVLFRVFLFFTIAVLYIAWFYWAVRGESGISGKGKFK